MGEPTLNQKAFRDLFYDLKDTTSEYRIFYDKYMATDDNFTKFENKATPVIRNDIAIGSKSLDDLLNSLQNY